MENEQCVTVDTETVANVVAASVACVTDENSSSDDQDKSVKNAETLELYNVLQTETVKDVNINPELSQKQQDEVKHLLNEFREIFSDVPKVTHLAEHKVELTQSEPIKCKQYPIPYKMQEVVEKEVDKMLEMGIIERSEASYASPLVLVKKPDNTYRVCVNFRNINKITVFDPELMNR